MIDIFGDNFAKIMFEPRGLAFYFADKNEMIEARENIHLFKGGK